MQTNTQRVNALVPGDWPSLRDTMRDLAADVDKLNAKIFATPKATTGTPPNTGDGDPTKESSKPS